ncbi:MAG TPA: hypothetical protein VLB82_01770 [Thermodesulfobacteriota bacterium]|nr:hypothetical protein [Thermodesulfobacteriota bacterium]
MKRWLVSVLIIFSIIYICTFLSIKYKYTQVSSVQSNYILLEESKISHKIIHIIFYPALWIDYQITGQEYGLITNKDHPYWIFAD